MKSKLATRRDNARKRLYGTPNVSTKTFNLHWVNETLDTVITELNQYAEREPEIKAAISVIVAAKRLTEAYSKRMIDTPFKSTKKVTDASVAQTMVATYRNRLLKWLNKIFNVTGGNDLISLLDIINDFDEYEKDNLLNGDYMNDDIISELEESTVLFDEAFTRVENALDLLDEDIKNLDG